MGIWAVTIFRHPSLSHGWITGPGEDTQEGTHLHKTRSLLHPAHEIKCFGFCTGLQHLELVLSICQLLTILMMGTE